jgi:hypothetical protein
MQNILILTVHSSNVLLKIAVQFEREKNKYKNLKFSGHNLSKGPKLLSRKYWEDEDL